MFNTIKLMLLQCRPPLTPISSKLLSSSRDKRPIVGEDFVKLKGLSSTIQSSCCKRNVWDGEIIHELNNSVEAEAECLARGN